jgi:hypothetical protein
MQAGSFVSPQPESRQIDCVQRKPQLSTLSYRNLSQEGMQSRIEQAF